MANRYVNYDKLLEERHRLGLYEMSKIHKVNAFNHFIDNIPIADVVEVVRCKDCKRCYEKRTKLNNQLMRFCMRMDGKEYQVNANDFCSYGTPKERSGEK